MDSWTRVLHDAYGAESGGRSSLSVLTRFVSSTFNWFILSSSHPSILYLYVRVSLLLRRHVPVSIASSAMHETEFNYPYPLEELACQVKP